MSNQQIVNQLIIPQRKSWSPQQDAVLRQIITTNKSQQWSQIAKIMEAQYNIIGRTGKQCRQRWHNQLDPNIKNQSWNSEEQDKLFEYHNQFGNKWAKIAQMLPGRTDNCVKNHFYCTLRKSLRRINKFIGLAKNKAKYKQIKNLILSKIIAVAEEKFQRKLQVPEDLIQKCCDIKNKLIKYSKDIDTQQEQYEDDLIQLVDNIMDFNKAYKRKKNMKKSTKTETNRSQRQDDSNDEIEDQQNDKVEIHEKIPAVKKEISKLNNPEIQIPKPIAPQNVFSKKPSLRGYLLTPSMQMQLEDRLRPQFSVYPNFIFQPSSPPRMDGTASEADAILLNQLVTNPQRGFTPVASNPVFGQLRTIQSFDYENFRKRN